MAKETAPDPMPGNPHFRPTVSMTQVANEAAAYAPDAAVFHNAQAQVAATLALAFEQRTANMISAVKYRGHDHPFVKLIWSRMGES